MLNTRELAVAILIGLTVAVLLVIPPWRRWTTSTFGPLLKMLFNPVFLVPMALLVVWSSGWVALAAVLQLWDLAMLKDTLITVAFVGLPMLFKTSRSRSSDEIWTKVRSETIGLSVFTLFFVNLETLPLWAELLLVPSLVILGALQAFAQLKPEHHRLLGCLNVILILAGLGLFIWALVQTISQINSQDWWLVVRTLLMSIWLPAAMVPFFYWFAFFVAAQGVVHRMRRVFKMNRRATLGVVLGLHGSLKWASEFSGRYNYISRSTTMRQALRGMSEFRDDVDQRRTAEADRLANLEAFAGAPGADGTGAQLDRREFDGTKRALDFIHTAQALRYEQAGNRFWDDLTDLVVDATTTDRYGLPRDHGITVETTRGQEDLARLAGAA